MVINPNSGRIQKHYNHKGILCFSLALLTLYACSDKDLEEQNVKGMAISFRTSVSAQSNAESAAKSSFFESVQTKGLTVPVMKITTPTQYDGESSASNALTRAAILTSVTSNFGVSGIASDGSAVFFNVKGSWDNGWDFYTQGWQTGSTIWFPANGYRNMEDGGTIWQDKDENQGATNRSDYDYAQGSNWCAIPFNYKDGKCLTYRSNAVLKGDNTNRTEGNAVRCVKEK